MRIGFFTLSMFNGGAERVAAQLTNLWIKLGHEVVLCTSYPATKVDFKHQCIARERIDYARLDEQAMRSLKTKYGLGAMVFNDGIDDDVFQKNFLAARKIDGLKVYVILHHTANNWMYGTGNTRELFMDDLLARADAVICVDRIWALWWRHRGCNAVFIPNPVVIKAQKTVKQGVVELVKSIDEAVACLAGAKEIVWIGRLGDDLKRAELALEIFAKVLQINPEARMTMLGTKTPEIEKRLRKTFARNLSAFNIQSSATYLSLKGFVSDIGDYLSKADAHLFTSATEVTVPQVVREAQQLGVRTVAFDLPFLRRVAETVDDAEISEKWRKILAGEMLSCDFDSPVDYQNLLDEFECSQQYFVRHHLRDLLFFRRWKSRCNISYLISRVKAKIRRGDRR